MSLKKSISSWLLSLVLCATWLVQTSHGIDLLINEITSQHHESSHDKSSHHDENCSICHFHLSPSVLQVFSYEIASVVSFFHPIQNRYQDIVSLISSIYILLRAPPFYVF